MKRAYAFNLKQVALLSLVPLLIIAYSIALQFPSFLHPESPGYLINYLSPRGFFEKIFDPNLNEIGTYQARELSYFFDWINAQFISICTTHGFPHFFALSHYVGLILMSAVHIYFTVRHLPRHQHLISHLVFLLFLTSPSLLFSGFFFRSAKLLVTVCLFIMGWSFWGAVRGSFKSALVLLFFALFATVSDRQGFFMVVVSLILASFWLLYKKFKLGLQTRFLWTTLLGLAAAVMCGQFYNDLLGPFLVRHFGNTFPGFSFQHIELGTPFLANLGKAGALGLFLDTLGFQWGNLDLFLGLRVWAPCSIFLMLAVAYNWIRLKKGLHFWTTLLFFLLTLFMLAAMVQKHPPILWEDVRRTYYWMPLSVGIYFMGLLSVLTLRPSRTVHGILIVLLALNFAAWPRHRAVLKTGHLKTYIQEATSVRDCIGTTDLPIKLFNLTDPAAAWCDFMRTRMAVAMSPNQN